MEGSKVERVGGKSAKKKAGSLKAQDAGKRKSYPWLKQIIVATSFTPLKQLYIELYKVIIWYVARQVAKDPFVGAIYLQRGCARGEILPGVSDIDMVMIAKEVDYSSLPIFRTEDSLDRYRGRYQRWLAACRCSTIISRLW